MDAIKFSLHNVIQQLSSSPGVEVNSAGFQPGQPNFYKMPARTAAEVPAARAADAATVSPQTSSRIADPAAQLQQSGRDPYHHRKLLEARQQPQQPEAPHAEPVRDDNGEVSWLL